jgi:oligoribonuclease (3'-5' exoribonuclease)
MKFVAPQVAIFLDYETTGLLPAAPGAALLEIGMLAVEVPSFREVDAWSSVIVELDRLADPLKGCDDYVRKMHTENGLLVDLQGVIKAGAGLNGAPLPRLFNVQQAAIDFYNRHASGRRAYLCGAKPSFDRAWMDHHMPALAKKFHYRDFDTNAFFILREYMFGVEKSGQRHRVLDDCRQAVQVVHDHFDLMKKLFGRLSAGQIHAIREAIHQLGQFPGAGAVGAADGLRALLT